MQPIRASPSPVCSETGSKDRAGDPEPDQGERDPCDSAQEETGTSQSQFLIFIISNKLSEGQERRFS